MKLTQALIYIKYSSFLAIGIIFGRLSMAIQYALMKPKSK